MRYIHSICMSICLHVTLKYFVHFILVKSISNLHEGLNALWVHCEKQRVELYTSDRNCSHNQDKAFVFFFFFVHHSASEVMIIKC